MKKQNFFIITLISSVLFFNCSKSSGDLVQNENGSARATGKGTGSSSSSGSGINYTTRVSMQESSFNPAEVTVVTGGSILWANNDGEQVHTVTADDGSFDSGDLQPGSTFGFTFNIIGPHYYHCKYHHETGVVKCVTK
jgi:plastocyanin